MRDTPSHVLALSQLALVLHLQPELDRNFAVPAAAAECARTHAATLQRGGGRVRCSLANVAVGSSSERQTAQRLHLQVGLLARVRALKAVPEVLSSKGGGVEHAVKDASVACDNSSRVAPDAARLEHAARLWVCA